MFMLLNSGAILRPAKHSKRQMENVPEVLEERRKGRKKNKTSKLTIDKQRFVLLHDGELLESGSAAVLVRSG